MAVKSRRIKNAIEDGTMPEDMHFCRKCIAIKRKDEFHKAVDLYLDSAGVMSVCKKCVNEIFGNFLESEGSVQKATYKACKILNVKYDEDSISSALQQIESRGWNFKDSFFGTFRAKLVANDGKGLTDAISLDLTFQDNVIINIDSEQLSNDSFEGSVDLKLFWGEHFSSGDFEFLEKELADWKKSYSCQNKGEEFILKELSYKALELKKARVDKKGTDTILKQIQEIMKTGSLTPAQANASSSNKNADAFGNWIKDIENLTPAEWVKDKSAFRDVDNLEEYTQTYIVSPLRSFVTGSKEFNVEGTDQEDDEEE